jgi:hypothetical protein
MKKQTLEEIQQLAATRNRSAEESARLKKLRLSYIEISNQIDDFDKSARRVTKELANLSYSNNPSLDIMYFSGTLKLSIAKNKAILIETCIRPTLDQMLILKDTELKFLEKNGKILWKICERRKKAVYYEGVGLNDLHAFKWSRIK